jgi:hypothetical protein
MKLLCSSPHPPAIITASYTDSHTESNRDARLIPSEARMDSSNVSTLVPQLHQLQAAAFSRDCRHAQLVAEHAPGISRLE